MRYALLLLCFSLLIAACGPPAYVEVGPSYPSYPGYVYVDVGGCWADDVWYAGRCPWYAGPSYGMYWYGQGRYVYRPGHVWRDHRQPPPPHWRPPARDHRTPAPPTTRDHRRHR